MRKDRSPIPPEFDDFNPGSQEDRILHYLPFAQDVLVSEAPIFTPVKVSDDSEPVSPTIDLYSDENKSFIEFITNQKEVVMVGRTLEQLKYPDVELRIKAEVLNGSRYSFVIANPEVNKPLNQIDEDLFTAFEKLETLRRFADVFEMKDAVNVFLIPSFFPEDFVWVGGWENMLVRIQNEKSRGNTSKYSQTVDYLSIQDPDHRYILESLFTDFCNMFELAEAIDI